MKKLYLVFVSIVLLVLGFWVGKYLYKLNTIDAELLAKAKANYNSIQEEFNSRFSVAAVNSKNEKISPVALLTFKTTYEKCGHTLNEYKNVSEDEINFTEEELQEKYKDWNIAEFSEKEIVMVKNVPDSCNEHFMIRENNGTLAIYIIDENDRETLKDTTNIATKYLTKLDLEKVREGIRANGIEELNAKLEDFE